MPDPKIPFAHPVISVDRGARTLAVFDDFNLVRDFKPFADEQTAVAEAKAWIAEHTTLEPDIVYPRIDKVVMTTGRTRKRR